MSTKAAGGAVVLVNTEDVAPGDIVNFLLTAALYKAKAHGKTHLWPHPSPWWREAVASGGRMLRPWTIYSGWKNGAPTGTPFPTETGFGVSLFASSERYLPSSSQKTREAKVQKYR